MSRSDIKNQIRRTFGTLFIRETGVTTGELPFRAFPEAVPAEPEVVFRRIFRFRRPRFFRAPAFFIRAASGPATSLNTASKFLPDVVPVPLCVFLPVGVGPKPREAAERVLARTGLRGATIQAAKICLNFRVNRLRTAPEPVALRDSGDHRWRNPGENLVVWPDRGLWRRGRLARCFFTSA